MQMNAQADARRAGALPVVPEISTGHLQHHPKTHFARFNMAKAMGRPTKYSEKLAQALCERMAMGESLRKACEHSGMPSAATVFNWLVKYPDFLGQYDRARELSRAAVAEEYFGILDEEPERKADGSVDSGWVAWTRNRADARKWYLSKIAPKQFGDKLETTLQGPNGGPVDVNHTVTFVKP